MTGSHEALHSRLLIRDRVLDFGSLGLIGFRVQEVWVLSVLGSRWNSQESGLWKAALGRSSTAIAMLP